MTMNETVCSGHGDGSSTEPVLLNQLSVLYQVQ